MEALITLIILATFAGLFVIDVLRPATKLPEVRGWRIKGIVFFVAYLAVATLLPLVWGELLWSHRLIDASGLGTIAGAVVGIVVLDLAIYAWHFALHQSDLLWRFSHQMHHSAERIDTAGAFYFSPLDMIGFTFASSVALGWAIGLTPEATLIANGVLTMLAMFQHANLRTPSWLAYVIQRPEQHAFHHERDVHGFNYGSISLWDLVFGTWRNPEAHRGPAGFYDGASRRIGSMLIGRDLVAEHRDATPTRSWRPVPLIPTPVRRPAASSQPQM